MKKYDIIFSDLDGTLIKTISGETFPKGIWDMQIRFEVPDKIKEVKPEYLLIKVALKKDLSVKVISVSNSTIYVHQ